MNKFGVILGVAAVATLAGCKDPDYVHGDGKPSQGEVKNVQTTPAPAPVVVDTKPATPKCMCLPGTKHTEPCKCGSPDCKCVVVTKPIVTVDLTKKPAEPEYTVYTVQNGDYLAKISKKFNVTISSIKRLNPSIKSNNVICVGQKLKIPGKVDAGAAAAPSNSASATKAVAKKAVVATAYAGATKEYVVKSGDTLGSIAYGNGINIRQLKSMNNLTNDTLKVGQKLKIPAEKVVKKAAKADEAKAPAAEAKKPETVKKPEEAPVAETPAPAEADAEKAAAPVTEQAEADAAKAVVEPAKDAKPATMNYTVGEGEDMTAVCIRWNVTAAEIRELNKLPDGAQLTPGQIIKLPADAQQ